jgi:glycosyltransferase involved in cell wall biosynthesis
MPLVNTALTLKDLPPAPEGKRGWPWTEQTEPLPDKMADGSDWPRISIVTPSYNQGQFIEETIRSVLLQGYPNLEYIIIDGSSDDNSVEVIKKYESWLAHWVSEPDNGQSDALNKGFHYSSGTISAYLNSDDLYFPNVFWDVADVFLKKTDIKWLGSIVLVGENINTSSIWYPSSGNLPLFVANQLVAQPGVFWISEVLPKPYFDVNRQHSMDHKFFAEIYLKFGPPFLLSRKTSFYRYHKDSKTCSPDQSFMIGEKKKLSKEISDQCDEVTAKKIHQELTRQLAGIEIHKLFNKDSLSIRAAWHQALHASLIAVNTPFLFRDRVFLSVSCKLWLRLIRNVYTTFVGASSNINKGI